MKHRPLLYIETSVFGFYYDDEPRNAGRKESVRELFREIDLGIIRAVTSPLTADELAATSGPKREQLLQLLEHVEELDLDEAEVRRITAAYMTERVIPADYAADARHVACATVAGVDVVVTLNLRHLANEWAERRLNAVNLREGYTMLSIRTPDEVVLYED
jgi:predicted nucleic acid-binding protein